MKSKRYNSNRNTNQNKPDPEHLAFYYGLEKSQWWPSKELEQYQFHHLNRLLVHAVQNNEYYRNTLTSIYSPQSTALNAETWQQLPILKRKDVQSAGSKLYSQNVPSNHGKINTISTSGSTGAAITIKKTELSNKVWLAQTLRDHIWHKRNLESRLAIIRIFEQDIGKAPLGTKTKGWGPATNIINHLGSSHLLDINTPINIQAEWLLKLNPEYILTYPNNIKALIDYFIQHNLSLPALKEIRTLGEVVDDNIRELCFDVWKVNVCDVYSAQETGYIALQCPKHTHYHIQSENVYVEVLDDEDNPCQAGEIGRVIITPLHNFATPLIRYEIGDFAEVGAPCKCGRRLPVLNKILGRSRNLFKLENGETFWPLTGMQEYRKYVPILKSQLVQKSLSELELNIVAERPLSSEESTTLINVAMSFVKHDFTITLNQLDDIPRSANGKYEDVVCMI